MLTVKEQSCTLEFATILEAALNIPGVRINRDDFLNKELSRRFGEVCARKAIEKTPAEAGIHAKELTAIADACIKYETNRVTALSAAAGLPGGLAMFGSIPADVIQYFVHVVRIVQKLIYLYGWQEINSAESDLSDETLNQLTLFIGVMFGVNAANAAIGKIAESAAVKAEKTLVAKALNKGTIYPVVKQVAGLLGLKMNKSIFAKGVGKIIPGIGAIVSGGITYSTFMPLSHKLKKYLETLPTADANIDRTKVCKCDAEEIDFTDIIQTCEESV